MLETSRSGGAKVGSRRGNEATASRHLQSDQKEEKHKRTAVENAKSVKTLYDKIESIRRTMSVANAERAEFWVQRQNLQDLYHQIILT